MNTIPEDAAKWLDALTHLHPDAPQCWVAIAEEGGKSQEWLQRDAAGDWAARFADQRSIYVAIHAPADPYHPPTGRAAAELPNLRCLPLDVDNGGEDFPLRLDEAVKAGPLPPPTLMVETSRNKYQCLWVYSGFETDIDLHRAAVDALALRFGGDHTMKDAARILRIPGYYNRKKKYVPTPLAKLLRNEPTNRYTLKDLAAILGASAVPARVPLSTTAGQTEWTEADRQYRTKEWPRVLAALPRLEFNAGKSQAIMIRAVMTAGDWGFTEDEVATALGPWLIDAQVHPSTLPNPDAEDRAGFAQRLYSNTFAARKEEVGVLLRHSQAIAAWWEDPPAHDNAAPPTAEDHPPAGAALPATLGSLIAPNLERLRRRAEKKEKPVPLPWPSLAKQLCGGLWPGLHMLVGNTGTGKTQLALRVALNAARAGVPVLYVALELGEVDLVARLLTMDTNTPWSKLFLGEDLKHVEAAERAAPALADLPFHMEFGPPGGWSSQGLAPAVKAIRETRRVDKSVPVLVVVDYLQIVGDPQPGRRPMELRERIGRAAYDARQVAREQDAAVLMISSTARENYRTLAAADATVLAPDGKVAPDGLVGLGKESGEIEYAADTVSVAIRWPDPLPRGDERAEESATSILIATPKVRAGRPAWTELRFNGWHFTEPADPTILQKAMVARSGGKTGEDKPKKSGGEAAKSKAAVVAVDKKKL